MSRRLLTTSVLTLALTASAGYAAATPPATGAAKAGAAAYQLSWQLLDTPTGTARLRGLDPVSGRVVWASGSEGTVLRSTDGGRSWGSVGPEGAEALEFRDIEASSARNAVILSIGEGGDSRVYRTTNGGKSWRETFRNDDARAFYDCMAFTSPDVGYAMSDPVDGKFRIIKTTNGGTSWKVLPPAGMPDALPGEFGFAASGTCLQTDPSGVLTLATGGPDAGRVFRSANGGRVWTVTDTPVAGGEAAGIYSVSFLDRRRGVAVGGDYTAPTGGENAAAWTRDGGRTWNPISGQSVGGYRSGSAWTTRVYGGVRVLAVGPTGSDVSYDEGRSWLPLDAGSFDAVECVDNGVCFASGEKGRVALLQAR